MIFFGGWAVLNFIFLNKALNQMISFIQERLAKSLPPTAVR